MILERIIKLANIIKTKAVKYFENELLNIFHSILPVGFIFMYLFYHILSHNVKLFYTFGLTIFKFCVKMYDVILCFQNKGDKK